MFSDKVRVVAESMWMEVAAMIVIISTTVFSIGCKSSADNRAVGWGGVSGWEHRKAIKEVEEYVEEESDILPTYIEVMADGVLTYDELARITKEYNKAKSLGFTKRALKVSD